MNKANMPLPAKRQRLSSIRDEGILRLLISISEDLAAFDDLDEALRYLVEESSKAVQADRA